MTKYLNVMIISFTVGIMFNFSILLLSIVRVINFVTRKTALRAFSYTFALVYSILYLNKSVQMMAYYWGMTAYDLSLCIKTGPCLNNKYNQLNFYKDRLSYSQYFQSHENIVRWFNI